MDITSFLTNHIAEFGAVMWINLLLSGDNALIIAMVCRELPDKQRKWGMIIGTGFAVVCRIVLLMVAATVLDYPGVKLAGGLFLVYVAWTMAFEEEEDPENKHAAENLWMAVFSIAVADIMMSADNVIAVAAAAHGNSAIMIAGIVVSIPMVIAGATIVEKVLDKLPVLVYAGAAYLLYLGSMTLLEDPLAKALTERALTHI